MKIWIPERGRKPITCQLLFQVLCLKIWIPERGRKHIFNIHKLPVKRRLKIWIPERGRKQRADAVKCIDVLFEDMDPREGTETPVLGSIYHHLIV